MLNKKWFFTLFATNLIALIDSIYLTYHHYKINILRPASGSFCSINSIIDCDIVATSSYAEIFNIPISTIGIFAYLFLALFLMIGYRSNKLELKKVLSISQIVLAAMLLFSLFELSISVFVLNTICLMCSLLYVCVIVMFFAAKLAIRHSFKDIWTESLNFFANAWPFGKNTFSTIACSIIFLFAIASAYTSDLFLENHFIKLANLQSIENEKKLAEAEQEGLENAFNALPVAQFNLNDSPMKGPQDAAITIVEFSDFQCPACAGRAESLLDLVKKFPGKVRLFFKNYPLDNHCNPEIKSVFHPFACAAAKHAYCAFKQSKFWSVHDDIYLNRQDLGDKYFKSLITKFKLDNVKFQSCLAIDAPKKITADLTEANKLKVDYTPTIYLNGRKVSDIAKTNGDLIHIINLLLDKQLK